MASKKTGKVSKAERGKIIADLIEKFYSTNDLDGLKSALKEELKIEEVSTKILQNLKLIYVDYALENGLQIRKFPALVAGARKEVLWNKKALVISTKLVPQHLVEKAIEEKVKYRIEMDDDFSVRCVPIIQGTSSAPTKE